MKHALYLLLIMPLLLGGCQRRSADDDAAVLLATIDKLYQTGEYRQALDSIESLRMKYPKAVEARKKALVIWQEASLREAQADIARTDSLLQQALLDFERAQSACTSAPIHANLLRRNQLGVRRDSLQARYDAMCALVRVIHKRQKEN